MKTKVLAIALLVLSLTVVSAEAKRGLPDLVVRGLTIDPVEANAGDSVHFEFEVRNVGRRLTGAPTVVRLNFGDGESEIFRIPENFRPGEKLTFEADHVYSEDGEYKVKVKVDPRNKVREIRERNNVRRGKVMVLPETQEIVVEWKTDNHLEFVLFQSIDYYPHWDHYLYSSNNVIVSNSEHSEIPVRFFISGSYPGLVSEDAGAICPYTNVIFLDNFEYRAKHGSEFGEWSPIPYENTENPPTFDSVEIFSGEQINPGEDVEIEFRVDVPVPCYPPASFEGEFYILGCDSDLENCEKLDMSVALK